MKKNRILEKLKAETKKKESKHKQLVDKKWVLIIIITSYIISIILSLLSELLVPNFSLFLGVVVTIFFIGLGILFDIIGVSVTTADSKIFHSMNSRKVRGAAIAVLFKKNSDKVSSFCCDVIGDICGVVSGISAVAIALLIAGKYNVNVLLTSLIVTGIISALTIGGKAMGKSFAINKSDIILYEFSKFVSYFYKESTLNSKK